jgi:hypothetical protein
MANLINCKSQWPLNMVNRLSFGHLDGPLAFFTKCLVCHMVKNVTLINVPIKHNFCLSCPKALIKITIPFGQCGCFNQVGPFKK